MRALGRIVGDFAGSTFRASVAGGDLRLTVDLELQQWIHSIFPQDKMGAVSRRHAQFLESNVRYWFPWGLIERADSR